MRRLLDDNSAMKCWVSGLVLLGLVQAQAAILAVPSTYSTIQAAIDAAPNGDDIVVAPGEYPESLNLFGKAIRVASEHGPELTIVTGDGTNEIVRFIDQEPRECVLTGFTLRDDWGRGAMRMG